jgi:serine/threonine protein kinase
MGVILVEMLTGRRPFRGETYNELFRAVMLDTYHLPGESPEIRALDEVLQRCLAKEPQNRIESAVILRQELIPILRVCPESIAAALLSENIRSASSGTTAT